ncbi:MAG: hypothetical protein M1827_006229 [Pycnora praestabilis]|nr:MAG: hypothetical protein M1827_006229 [Pycnora praestabilis]
MSNHPSSRASDAKARKNLRKGTHSCSECRRRKIRCIYRPDNPLVCVECFARGSQCQDQRHVTVEAITADTRPNLRERVARLENLMEAVLKSVNADPNNNIDISGLDTIRRDAAEALSNLRSEAFPVTPTSSDSSTPYPAYSDNAPFLSIFDNAVISRKCDQVSHEQQQDTGQHALESMHLDDHRLHPKTKAKRAKTRGALLALLPSLTDLRTILGSKSTWWERWRLLFPEIVVEDGQQTLLEYVLSATRQDNPAIVGIGILCVGLSIRQLRLGDEESLNLKRSPKDVLEHYMAVLDHLIISDDEYTASCEGIELMILQAKTHVNLGQPRKGWLLIRRSISLAQLIGLRPAMQPNDQGAAAARRVNTWWALYSVDRYISLLLGLPHAMTDEPEVGEGPYATQKKLSIIVGRVINRNQATSTPSLASTLDIDQQLEDLVKSAPEQWWSIPTSQSLTSVSIEVSAGITATHFWYCQTKAFLHLPFMLQSATDRRYDYNRHACLDASRKMVQLYHALRLDDGGAFFMCKIMDFQAFTAAMLLLLSLLGYGRMSSAVDHEEEEKDAYLIDTTVEILRQASSAEPDDIMVAQALNVLGTLSEGRRKHTVATSEQRKDCRPHKFVVPYFGTITISLGEISSNMPSATPERSLGTVAHQLSPNSTPNEHAALKDGLALSYGAAGGLFPSNNQQSISENDPNAIYGAPFIDIDWSNMVNMDLDQDWNWVMNEAEL